MEPRGHHNGAAKAQRNTSEKAKTKPKKELSGKRSTKLKALLADMKSDLESEKVKRAEIEQELQRVREEKNDIEAMLKQLKESEASASETARRAEIELELEQVRKEKDALEATLNKRQQLNRLEPSVSDDGSIGFDPALGSTSTQRAQNRFSLNDVEGTRFLSSVNQLSVSSINLPECKPLEGDFEIYRHTYESWRELLEDTMRLAGVQDEATKFTIFKIKAGPALLQIFRNTRSQPDAPDTKIEPFSNAMHRLKTYFSSGSDVMLQRRKLSLMTQNHEESSLAFITRVGTTARLCEYGEDKELEEIVRTIAEKALSKEVRIAALKMVGRKGCSFSDLIDTVRELEAIRINEEYFKQKHLNKAPAAIAAVRAAYTANDRPLFPRPVTRGGKYRQFSSRRRDGRFNPSSRESNANRNGGTSYREYRKPDHGYSNNQPNRCWRCNSIYHFANDCAAIDKVCDECGQTGHIKRACRSSNQPGVTQRKPEKSLNQPEGNNVVIAAVEKIEADNEQSEVSETIEN